jgi:hypothetical protein
VSRVTSSIDEFPIAKYFPQDGKTPRNHSTLYADNRKQQMSSDAPSLDGSGDRGGCDGIDLLQKFLPPVQPRQNHSLHINRLCLVRVLLSHNSGGLEG